MDPLIPTNDFRNALRILGHTLPETEEEAAAFIAAYDAGEIEHPTIPEHLSPSAIVAAIQGRTSSASDQIVTFPKKQPAAGISGLRLAARNGEEPLSEETIRKMKEAQED